MRRWMIAIAGQILAGILAYRKSGWGDHRVLRWRDGHGNRSETAVVPEKSLTRPPIGSPESL